MDISGYYSCNDGGHYYVRQIGKNVFWFGEHPNGNWANVFKGKLVKHGGAFFLKTYSLIGYFYDVPKGKFSGRGELKLSVNAANFTIQKKTGSFGGSKWKRTRLPAKLPGKRAPGFEQINNYKDMDGVWQCNDGGRYYIREIGGGIAWFGEGGLNRNGIPKFANVALGSRRGNTITLDWADVAKCRMKGGGQLKLRINHANEIVRISGRGFGGSKWNRGDGTGQMDPKRLKPQLVVINQEDYTVRGKKFTRVNFKIKNKHIFPNILFRAAPDLPPCGNNKNSARTWVNIFSKEGKRLYGFCALSSSANLDKLWYAYPQGKPPTEEIYVELHDRKNNKKFISNKVVIVQRQYYTVKNTDLKMNLPFNFSENFFPYIYKGLNAGNGHSTLFTSYNIPWINEDNKEISHLYLQNANNKNEFFYLPDEFKLLRTSDGRPWFNITFEGDNIDNAKAKISYKVGGYVETDRIEAAIKHLVKNDDELKENALQFSPWAMNNGLIYKVQLPNSTDFEQRPNALLNLEEIVDTVSDIEESALSSAFKALLENDETKSVFTGQLEVILHDGLKKPIPVSLRFQDMIGEELVSSQTITKALEVKVGNNSGKDLKVEEADFYLLANGQEIPALAFGIQFPFTLANGANHTFHLFAYEEIPNISTANIKMIGQLAGAEDEIDFGSSLMFTFFDREAIRVDVQNIIESPMFAQGIAIQLVNREEALPAKVLSPEFPMTIEPEELTSFLIIPDNQSLDLKEVIAVLEWKNLDIQLDENTLYDAVVDPTVFSNYQLPITITEMADAFSGTKPLRAIEIELRTSEMGPPDEIVTLTKANEEKEVNLSIPRKNRILQVTDEGTYWYRIVAISNERITGEWKARKEEKINVFPHEIPIAIVP